MLGIDELAAVRFAILEKLASRKDVLIIGSERLGWRCRVDVRRIEIPVCLRLKSCDARDNSLVHELKYRVEIGLFLRPCGAGDHPGQREKQAGVVKEMQKARFKNRRQKRTTPEGAVSWPGEAQTA